MNENTAMTDGVKLYRKRLNRWKNIGVCIVFISVGITLVSIGVIEYHLRILHQELDYSTDEDIHKWMVIGIVFGGVNIIG